MLREVQLNIGVEKVDTHINCFILKKTYQLIYSLKDVIVKILLDSGITEIFIDKKMAEKHEFNIRGHPRDTLSHQVSPVSIG